MKSFYTTSVFHPSPAFDDCYALMQNTFPADELVDRAEYEALLAAPCRLDHPHWFHMMARWIEPFHRTHLPAAVIGVLAGSYMALNSTQSIGMIEYLAVADGSQREGQGSALLQSFERALRIFAHQRGETLCWLVGEVEDELLPFKFHLGYGVPQGLRYVQPPIEFDEHGQPCYGSVAKHLAMKPMNDQPMVIEPSMLKEVIRTIYHWRYVPVLGDESAKLRAAAFIDHEIYPHVAESIGEEPIVLQQITPER